jgi:DNA primase
LKNALCLWANTGIPCLAVQGEAYDISDTAVKELKRRFKNVCVLYDNDPPGIQDALKTCKKTGFINIKLPDSIHEKDISDYFKAINDKQTFRENLLFLFKDVLR